MLIWGCDRETVPPKNNSEPKEKRVQSINQLNYNKVMPYLASLSF